MAITSPSLVYLMPVLAFFFIFVVTYAMFAKTKILGSSELISVLASFLIAAMFVLNPLATKFTVATVPWVAVLIFILVFILLLLTFVHGKIDELVKSPVVALIIVGVVMLVFIGAASNVFGPLLTLLQGGGIEQQAGAWEWLTNPSVLGALIITIIAGITSWILTR